MSTFGAWWTYAIGGVIAGAAATLWNDLLDRRRNRRRNRRHRTVRRVVCPFCGADIRFTNNAAEDVTTTRPPSG